MPKAKKLAYRPFKALLGKEVTITWNGPGDWHWYKLIGVGEKIVELQTVDGPEQGLKGDMGYWLCPHKDILTIREGIEAVK